MNRSATWLILIFAALALFCATAARADYGAGRTAWEAGRYAEALKEWRGAASKGDSRAMLALGRAFVKGLGVPKDFIEAHKWLNLAAARGDAKAAAERDALAKEMTVEERAEARKLARAWRPAGGPRTSSLLPRRKAQRPASPTRRTVRKGPAGRAARASATLRAASAGDASALEKALAAGADPNARGKRGWTPLMYAANKGYTLLVPPLLEAGAKPNLRAADGATALFIAALHGRSEIIAALMKAGADPSIKGPKGKTAAEVGYLGKNPRVMEALGLIKTIRESDGMVWKGAVLGGERHGRWTKTRADGVIMEEGPYLKGEKHGRWTKTDTGGVIVEEGPYVKGKKHGRWKEVRKDQLELGVYTINIHGEVYTSTVSDRIEAGPYVKGERHGGWTLSGKGSYNKFRAEGPYVKGEKHGDWKLSSRHGHWKAKYQHGERDGYWEWKSRDGVFRTYGIIYRKGKLRKFHKTQNISNVSNPCDWHNLLQVVANFDDKGLLHGNWRYSVRKFYISGKYVRGKKHGRWTHKKYRESYSSRVGCHLYFDDGDVEKVYYEYGKRIKKVAPSGPRNDGEVEEQNED